MYNIKESTILIVDDNPQNIQLVSSILSKAGYKNILFSTSGEDALEIFNETVPDLILLDILMPGMDGYEVCEKLKSNKQTKDISIMFLTAKTHDVDVVKGLDLGAVDYITKPFERDILLARVKTHLTVRMQEKLLEDDNKLLEERVIREVEKKLKSNAKLYALYEQSNFGVSFLNSKGEFLEYNDKLPLLLGYSREEFEGIDFMTVILPEDRKHNIEQFNKVIQEGETFVEFDKRCIKKDGSIVWFHTKLIKLHRVLNSNDFYIAAVCEDISDKVKLAEELKVKEDMLVAQSRQATMGNMIGMIAHQWRQPLSIINMIVNNIQLDIVLESIEDNVGLEDDIKSILEQTEYLNQSIEDFRNFFRPNKEKISTDVNQVMRQTLKLINKSFENNNIEVLTDYNAESRIEIYPNELMQVFINIINNAKDAIGGNNIENGKITVKTMDDEKNIVILIEDNAGGIPLDTIERMGKLYFSTKGDSGTGLGLYMSKMIIENQLNGSINWKNENDGAVFSITIPR